MKTIGYGLLSIALLLLIWQVASMRVLVSDILPSPHVVGSTLWRLLGDGTTYTIIGRTFFRLIIALLIASVTGILLGLSAALSQTVDAFLQPVVTILRTIPVASIIVIAIIYLEPSNAVYLITFLMLFPILHEATKQGVKNINPTILDAVALEEHRFHFVVWRIHLPLTFPFIKTAFLQGVGLGFKVLVMAEFIGQVSPSIGRSLNYADMTMRYDLVFAWTIIIIVLVMIMEIVIRRLRKDVHG